MSAVDQKSATDVPLAPQGYARPRKIAAILLTLICSTALLSACSFADPEASERPAQAQSYAPAVPPTRVVIAFDGSAHGFTVVNRLASSPLMAGLPVLLATVGATTSTEAAVAEAAHGLRGRGFLVMTKTLEGDPAPMLSELANQAGTVLVIGAYGHSRIRQFIVGSTTTALLRDSEVPVLVLR